MAAFDIFLLISTILALAWGAYSGFFRQLGSLAGLVLGIVACRTAGPGVAGYFVAHDIAQGVSATVIAYALTFLIVYSICKLLSIALKKMAQTLSLGIIDRLAGGALRCIIWIFVLSIALNVWGVVSPSSLPKSDAAEAVEAFAPWALGQGNAALPELPPLPDLHDLPALK